MIVVLKRERVDTRIHAERLADRDALPTGTDSGVDVLRDDLIDW